MAKKSERQKKLERFANIEKRNRIYKYIALGLSAAALSVYLFIKYFLKP